jgi:hypothetical protein
MNGKKLKAILATITTDSMTNGSMSDLWETLPDFVSGSDWVGEIHDMARMAADWITDDQEYTADIVDDLPSQLADSEIEDYYANINKRVQSLSLWAYDELDDEVSELFNGDVNPTITDLNSNYLYCAMRGLAYNLLSYAVAKVTDLEDAI